MRKMIRDALLFPTPLLAYFRLIRNFNDALALKKLHLTERLCHMHTHIDSEEHLEMDSLVQWIETDTDILAQRGFSPEEIAALLWLRQWYQTGGSDRVQIVRHMEFLKLLVLHSKLEL
jgi:hypothetical protein